MKLMRAITSLCLVIGLSIGLIPPSTANAANINDFSGRRFNEKHICILIHNGVWESWPIATAAAYFDSSGQVDLVVRKESQGGCGTYGPFQTLHIRQDSMQNGDCGSFRSSSVPFPVSEHPGNPYYSAIYGDLTQPVSPEIKLNTAYSSCYSSNTRLANTASQYIGFALGLAKFSTARSDPSVMLNTDYNRARTPWATAYDRNNIYALYRSLY